MMMTPSEKMKMKLPLPPKSSLTLLPCFYFVELPIVLSSMLSLYFLELTDFIQPVLVGFRCRDRDLSLPYVDGGDELIPLLMLLSLAFAGPAASIMLVEALVYCMESRLKVRRAEGSINAGGCNFNSFLRRTVRFVGVHVFGLCSTALVTDVIQLSTGYHTPFFLTVCKPNYSLVVCEGHAYITRDICQGHDLNAITAARKTFPSQHATLSAFAAVYVSMYFNSTISDSTKLLKPLLVFIFIIAAALTGLTQITQHRSHAIDVYVGFLIGGFIAAYLAFHAVGNFKSSDDITVAPPPPVLKEDPLRALTERGHDSVYNKGPASASESNDEITAAPAPLDRLEGLGPLGGSLGGPLGGSLGGPLQRDGSMGSLKRASVDVELLAPRSPMGKETMLTFSNTLPRASMAPNGAPGAPGAPPGPEDPVQPVQPVQRRLKAVQVPVDPLRAPLDPLRAQQLVSEWKAKSLEIRGVRDEDADAGEDASDASDDGGSQAPIYPTAGHSGRAARNPAGGGAKAVATPRPPQIPEAGPPPVSPKSAVTRAKWLAIREKASGEASSRSANQPRLLQVIAMTKQHGLLGSSSSETASTGSASSSDSRPPVVTVDAHAPHHPVVQAPPLTGNGSPWEWAGPPEGGDPRDAYDLNSLNRGDSAARGSSFRPHRSASPHDAGPRPHDAGPRPHDAGPRPHGETAADSQRREIAMRRKTALVLLDREIRNQDQDHQDQYYSLGGRRYKD